jgi:hypothetical protein
LVPWNKGNVRIKMGDLFYWKSEVAHPIFKINKENEFADPPILV